MLLFSFDVLEVLVRSHSQLFAGSLVCNDDGMRVILYGADGPHLGHRSLHGSLQGACLVVAVDEYHHLAGVRYRRHTYGQCLTWHLGEVVVEEAAVGDDGVCGERFDACA